MRELTESFIKKLAEIRANEIFTPEFYQHVTDSWYLDELFNFENHQIGIESRKPNKNEKDLYMKYLSDYFDEYEDRFYPDGLAQSCYGSCIDNFKKIFDLINYGNKKYSNFNIDEETIQKLKDIANIFVTKHNEFCK